MSESRHTARQMTLVHKVLRARTAGYKVAYQHHSASASEGSAYDEQQSCNSIDKIIACSSNRKEIDICDHWKH